MKSNLVYQSVLEFNVEVVRKRVKNMYLAVLKPDGRIRVTAPLAVKEEEIQRFIIKKKDWIKKHQEQIQSQVPLATMDYLTGDTVMVWGKPYQLTLVESKEKRTKQGSIHLTEDHLLLSILPESTRDQREAALYRWYRGELEQKTAELVPHWQERMKIHVTGWRIRDMKTRWGVCNTRTGWITMNLQLVKHSPLCLEYIVVHEIAHLLVCNHSREFYRVVEQYLPEWKAARAALRIK